MKNKLLSFAEVEVLLFINAAAKPLTMKEVVDKTDRSTSVVYLAIEKLDRKKLLVTGYAKEILRHPLQIVGLTDKGRQCVGLYLEISKLLDSVA